MDKIAIHCKTEELWEKVQEKAFAEGYGWGTCKEICNKGWNKYKASVCINLEDEKYILYAHVSFYSKEGYTIIPAEEYLQEFKVGDEVEIAVPSGHHTNGKRGIICEVKLRASLPYKIQGIDGYAYNKKDLKLIESEKSMEEDGECTYCNGKGCKACSAQHQEHSVPLREGDKVRVVSRGDSYDGLEGIIIDGYKGNFDHLVELAEEDKPFTKRNLELIPTEADITVGSVWEDGCDRREVISIEDGYVNYNNLDMDVKGRVEIEYFIEKGDKLIHRGDEGVGKRKDSTTIWIDSCVDVISQLTKQTNKKEKKMKRAEQTLKVGALIIDRKCENDGKVVYIHAEKGQVAYIDQHSGDLETTDISNCIKQYTIAKPKPAKKKKKR